jgi:uncharacterized membrane protein YqhA
MIKRIETLFEQFLWNARFLLILPVFFGVLLAFGLFLVATIDVVVLLVGLLSYFDPALTETARSTLRVEAISEVVGALDVYLIGALLLIFSLGFYELFIDKLHVLENSEFAERLLLIRSFDDLKDRLANVVQVVLIVKFFQQALKLKYESVLDLLLLAIGIALIGVALFLTRKQAFRSYEDGVTKE